MGWTRRNPRSLAMPAAQMLAGSSDLYCPKTKSCIRDWPACQLSTQDKYISLLHKLLPQCPPHARVFHRQLVRRLMHRGSPYCILLGSNQRRLLALQVGEE